MARPLREQFAIATFVLLVPVGAVMTFAWSQVYSGHMTQLHDEAVGLAMTVAAHFDVGGPAADSTFLDFVKLLRLPDNTTVAVKDEKGITRFTYPVDSAGKAAQTVERTEGFARKKD